MSYISRLNNRQCGRNLIRLLALLLALAVAAPTLFAQEWDHINGRDKDHDPIGAWLVTRRMPLVFYHFPQDGTTTATVRGDSRWSDLRQS